MQVARTPAVQSVSPVKSPLQPTRPMLLDASQLKLVSGGGPRGTWIEQSARPSQGNSI